MIDGPLFTSYLFFGWLLLGIPGGIKFARDNPDTRPRRIDRVLSRAFCMSVAILLGPFSWPSIAHLEAKWTDRP